MNPNLIPSNHFKMIYIDQYNGHVTAIPRDGLIGEWLFRGNANDTSGNGHNGTVNGAVLATGRKGIANTAYYFPNSTDAISIGNYCNIGTGNYTVSLWGNLPSSGSTFISKGSSPVAPGVYNLYWQPRFRIYYTSSQYYDSSTFSRSLNTWYHYLISIDRNGNMDFYIDNVLVGSVNISSSSGVDMTNTGVLVIGNNAIVNTRSILGYIQDVRIYNRLLTEAERTALYNE